MAQKKIIRQCVSIGSNREMLDRIVKGDLVQVSKEADPVIYNFYKITGIGNILGIVIACRYNMDVYLLSPVNSPFTDSSYWVEGRYLLPYEG